MHGIYFRKQEQQERNGEADALISEGRWKLEIKCFNHVEDISYSFPSRLSVVLSMLKGIKTEIVFVIAVKCSIIYVVRHKNRYSHCNSINPKPFQSSIST